MRCWLVFVSRLGAESPVMAKLHLVMDDYVTHKHPGVQGWVELNPRFVSRFIPTNSSWLNLIERSFQSLTSYFDISHFVVQIRIHQQDI